MSKTPIDPISVCDNCPHKEEYLKRIDELEANNIALAQQLIDHNQTFHSEENTVPYLRYEIDTLKAKISTLEAKNSDLETENHGLDENIYHYKNLLEDYEDRIAHFEQLLGRYYERDVRRDKERLLLSWEEFKEAMERHNGGA